VTRCQTLRSVTRTKFGWYWIMVKWWNSTVAHSCSTVRSPRVWCCDWRPGVLGRWPGCWRSGHRCHGSSTIRLGRTWTSWSYRGRWSWPLRRLVGMSRSRGLLAAHVLSPTGNAWPPWQFWASVRRSYPRCKRLALVDAAAWWLSEPNGGEEFAYALLAASCAAEVTAEHVYLALITPSDDGEATSP
jgi:hypothetical protein